MKDVATIPEDLVQARSRLAQVAEWIAHAESPEDLGAAAQGCFEAREWARIRKLSAEIRCEVVRLECIALRKLGVLGGQALAAAGLSVHYRSAAEYFSGLQDQEFEDLCGKITAASTPVSLRNIVRRAERQRFVHAQGYNLLCEPESRRYDASGAWGEDGPNVARAVRVILRTAVRDNEPFTVGDAADALVRHLAEGLREGDPFPGGSDFVEDPDFREGMSEVIRKALRESVAVDTGIPEFVTTNTADHGWVRIPWHLATLVDLEEMVAHRWAQVRDLEARATQLQELATEMTAQAVRRGLDKTIQLGVLHRTEYDGTEVRAEGAA